MSNPDEVRARPEDIPEPQAMREEQARKEQLPQEKPSDEQLLEEQPLLEHLSGEPRLEEQLLQEQLREEQEFGRILDRARDVHCPPEELYRQSRYGYSGEGDDVEFLSPRFSRMNKQGNPTWISVAPLHRESADDDMDRDQSLFSEQEAAFPSKRFGRKGRRNRQEDAPAGKLGGAGLLDRLMGRKAREHAADGRMAGTQMQEQGRGSFGYRRPRPLRAFVRVLLAAAALGLLYHFLARLGWVPRLW